jgi:hypothetical protein
MMSFEKFDQWKGSVAASSGGPLTREMIEEAANTVRGFLKMEWRRGGYTKVDGGGLCYSTRREGSDGPWRLLIKTGYAIWAAGEINTCYQKDNDGWFKLQDGATYDVRDPYMRNMLDHITIDYDKYINEQITVLE